MSKKNINQMLLKGILWAGAGQVGYVVLALAGNIFLARLLSPEEFGIVGIAMFFVAISKVFIEGGVGGALVRKENITDKDYSTVFIFNLVVSVILFGLLILIAEPVAEYYKQPMLKEVIWALSSLLIINAFTIVQNVKLIKEMNFKQIGLYKIVSLAIAVAISCYLAYIGYGVWAIVVMQITSAFLLMLILWFKAGFLGRLVFCKESFKEISSFGLYTTLSSVLNIGFENIYQLIIGKYFSLSQVGYYYQAKKLYQAPDGVFKIIILQVFYSYLSKFQEDIKVFTAKFNIIVNLTAIFLGFVLSLIYIYAEHIIMLLYGDKWKNSTFFLQLITMAGYFILLDRVNRNIFKIFDQTHKIFALEIFNKVIQLISISIGIYYVNLDFLLYGFIIVSGISYFVGLYHALKIIDNVNLTIYLDIIKIVFAMGCSIFLFIKSYIYFDITGYTTILLFPIYLCIYLFILVLLRVVNKGLVLHVKEVLNVK